MAQRFSSTLATGAFCLMFSSGSVAFAGNSVVLELYTSQGCSSCPAADAVLRDMDKQDDIIALSLNVSYWDYLGWKDDLALPGTTKRQRAYARRLNSRHVYTPQLMVDGQTDVVGSRRPQVNSAVAKARTQQDTAQISASSHGDVLQIQVSGSPKLSEDAIIWVVGYDRSVSKSIGGGENHGRTVEYRNVVREWHEAGRWNGASPITITSSKPAGSSGYAVIVQQGQVGPILGAMKHNY